MKGKGMKYPWAKWILGIALAYAWGVPAIAEGKITVFAAVSLTNALKDISKQYQMETQIEVVVLYDSSFTLAKKIAEEGTLADLFISADQQSMDYLAEKKSIIATSRYTLLSNELVLVAPIDSNIYNVAIDKQTNWKNLLDGRLLALGDFDHVPAGIYAKQALEYWGAWPMLDQKIVRTNNVRATLALVELAKVPLGIVYGSDAITTDRVRVVGVFPDQSHKPIEYPMAIVNGHDNPNINAFYAYLKSPTANTIFKNNGFSVVKK
ncbi:molybdate ABC transporter substrate-binding protein [Candidatus Regiella insecticola]|uniref:Molybdate ABC transporter substrate-binding protein n=2 Tax=Candidatus Regiella insecticola TaxID=138073 RepID=A0A6L2ZRR1_9ENTR|nr:molybdate ABC transporter substrate-binding protein [Candidatus Regiella insecticola]